MSDFKIKADDTLPWLTATIYYAGTTTPVDLSGAAATFSMRPLDSDTPKINKEDAEILAPATNGQVQYRWQVGDTDTVGKFEAEFEITFPTLTTAAPGDGPTTQILTAPDNSYLIIEVIEDVA